MNSISKLLTGLMFLALIGTQTACKKTFDEPPAPTDDINVVANTSIQTLKALHTDPRAYDIINDNIIISGIVVANDKSGNFYKQLFIQDSTGAIQLLLDANSLYGTYPVGRRVFVYCKGLCLTDYNNTMELGVKATVGGLPSVEGIPAQLISQYVKGGSINNPVVPTTVTLGDLTSDMQDRYLNSLIKLEGWEFTDTTITYSDTSAYKSTKNDTISNCAAKTIIRTSAYANFAGLRVPSGNGSITAIYTVFGSTKQFIIRDTNDVQLYNTRCGAAPTNALLFENFESWPASSAAPYVDVNIPGWVNVAEGTNFPYTNRTFNSNKYAYVSAFNSALPTANTWLVTKAINLDATTGEVFTFDTKQDFRMTNYTGSGTDVASTMRVMYSSNYTGAGDPFAPGVTWTDFTGYALSPGTTTGSPFPAVYTNSGAIDLSAISGTIYIAFKNEGSDPAGTANDHTSSWEIDNIKVIGN